METRRAHYQLRSARAVPRKFVSYRGNVALIGDASGSVDAITGEGLCLSFRQAVALAEALEAEDLRGYQEAHRCLLKRPTLMANMMLMLDRRSSAGACNARTSQQPPSVRADTRRARWSRLNPTVGGNVRPSGVAITLSRGTLSRESK